MKLTRARLKEIIKEEIQNFYEGKKTYSDTWKNRKLNRVGKSYTTREKGTGNKGGGTKFPQARPKGGPTKAYSVKKRKKSPGTEPEGSKSGITRKHAGDRLSLYTKLKKKGNDYSKMGLSWDEFDDIPDITDLIPKKK